MWNKKYWAIPTVVATPETTTSKAIFERFIRDVMNNMKFLTQ